jgi:nucleotide-binding universal stress UspA family protein
MIRSALLALDGSQASAQAQRIAIRVSLEQASHPRADGRPLRLVGVAVVDRPTIERPEPAPIGGSAFRTERDEALLAEAERKADQVLSQFKARCQEAGVPAETLRVEGLPYEQIAMASRRHDLIVIGKDTNFHFATSSETGDTVRRLLSDNPRPLLVTPAEEPRGSSIVIAYDSSRQSSHALHMWTLLDIRRDQVTVHVVSIAKKLDKARARCEEAAALLRYHDVQAEVHAIESQERVSDVLRQQLPQLDPQAVVIGAFGQSGLRERFFGSVTRGLIEDCPYPLFLAQ